MKIRLDRDPLSGELRMLHDAGQTITVVMDNDPASHHPSTTQTVASSVPTVLRWPSAEHEWISVPELGDPGLTEMCSECSATRRTTPGR
jgi:hypothetical protein